MSLLSVLLVGGRLLLRWSAALIAVDSRYPFFNRSQGGNEDHQSEKDEPDGNEWTSEAGNPVPQGSAASAHHQAVRTIIFAQILRLNLLCFLLGAGMRSSRRQQTSSW